MTTTDSRLTNRFAEPIESASGGDQLAGGQGSGDTHPSLAAGTELTDCHSASDALVGAAVGANSRSASSAPTPEAWSLSGEQPAGGQSSRDTHGGFAAGSNSRPAEDDATSSAPTPGGAQLTDRQASLGAHSSDAVGVEAGRGPAANERPKPITVSLLDPALALAADVLDDIERVRIANANRLQILTRSVEDSDGEVRGFGLDESHPDVARLAAMVELLGKVEHDAELNLGRMMRRHPLHAWIKAQRGIGDKQGARLLAAIGDPYVNSATGMPRTVSALWAYCGLDVLPASLGPPDARSGGAGRDQLPVDQRDAGAHQPCVGGLGGDPGQTPGDTQSLRAGVAPKRARGQRANWSTRAKTKAYLIATSCMKQLVAPCARDGEGPAVHVDACSCSAYRVVYDARRRHTAVTRPDWTDGHSHNDALRVASKAILRDLWRAAREHHLAATS